MKRILMVLIGFLWLAVTLHAQEIDSTKVPQVVRAKLWLVYPKAKEVTWSHDCRTQTSTVNGVTVEKQLCFAALFRDSSYVLEMVFDSTATWYQDWGHVNANDEPKNVPQQAKDRVASLVIPKMKIDWVYTEEFDSAKYGANLYSEDTSTEYNLYFDAKWQYVGEVMNVYDDSVLVPIHAINNYIRKNCKRSTFVNAEITKNINGNITQVVVLLKYRRRRRDLWSLTFDGKGSLLEPPTKIRSRYIFGIDF